MRRLVTALATVTFVIALGAPAWADTGTTDKSTYKVNSASELNRRGGGDHGDHHEGRHGDDGHHGRRGDDDHHGRRGDDDDHHGRHRRYYDDDYYYPGYCYGYYGCGYGYGYGYDDYYYRDCGYDRDYYRGCGSCYGDYYRHRNRSCYSRYSSCYGRGYGGYCNY
jgi:Ni/Co efflux regulator RcnB